MGVFFNKIYGGIIMGAILDISEWQVPSSINYDELAKHLDLVIVRVQYGSNYIDKHYKTHIAEFKKRGIPINVYAWVRGINSADMEVEATDFFNRAKEFNPSYWWLDIEEKTMGDMVGGCRAFANKLRSLTGKNNVGAYIANHLYSQFGFTNEIINRDYNALWVPTYGTNNGQYNGSNPTCTAYNNIDIHQYTSEGRLPGYGGALDLNRLTGKSPISKFIGGTVSKPTPTPQPQTSGWKAESGTFTSNTAIKLRTEANTNSGVIAVLPAGSVVKYDSFKIDTNGYVWIRQPRSVGYGFLATGESRNGKRINYWGTFE